VARVKKKVGPAGGSYRPYPRYSLERALQVAQRIKELNGGEPWSPDSIAEAVNVAKRSSNFQYLIGAARDFGLIEGNFRSPEIKLSELGRAIVYAPDLETEQRKKREAFEKIDIFNKVLAHYKGSNLPEMKYLGNTLKTTFQLPEEYHEEFSRLFKENCKFLNIEAGGSQQDESVSTAEKEPLKPRDVSATPTVKLAEAAKKPGAARTAFVIIPFSERDQGRSAGFFAEVLEALIVPAARDAGFSVFTANRSGSDVIQSTIINDLLDADLVIADLTDHNPNVLFELGLRIAQDTPVALIKSKDTGRIFDVDNMLRVFEYDQNLWKSTIEKNLPELTEHIEATWSTKGGHSYLKILRRQS
jgi:hypothetical protein